MSIVNDIEFGNVFAEQLTLNEIYRDVHARQFEQRLLDANIGGCAIIFVCLYYLARRFDIF